MPDASGLASGLEAAPPKPDHGGTFRALVGDRLWRTLPLEVQQRFGRELTGSERAQYRGEVLFTHRKLVGRLWAQLLRIVGAPLPLESFSRIASTVVVTAGDRAGAQCWTRSYELPGGKSQIIRSTKSFTGPTGLEERVGAGLSMALTVSVESRALVFQSAGYYWQWGGGRLSVPTWLTPGQITVRHQEEYAGRFSFSLTVDHPWLGRLIHQVALFQDAGDE